MQVEIHPIHDAVVLRKSGSELLILASHVTELKKRKTAKEFSEYFMSEALINRPARKLFENWLRKEGDLWRRIYHSVQTIEQTPPTEAEEAKPSKGSSKKAEAVTQVAASVPTVVSKKDDIIKKAAVAKDDKKSDAKKAAPGKDEKKAETKKAAPAAAKKVEKKPAPPAKKPVAAAKKAAPVAKKAPPARKPAPKKSSKK